MYEFTLRLNRHLNSLRARLGLPYWSLSKYLKLKVKRAVSYVSDFESAVAREARHRGVDGVVCGHIHHAELREIDGILYANDGDWVESLTALAEHADGRLEIVDWAAAMAAAAPSSAEALEPVGAGVAATWRARQPLWRTGPNRREVFERFDDPHPDQGACRAAVGFELAQLGGLGRAAVADGAHGRVARDDDAMDFRAGATLAGACIRSQASCEFAAQPGAGLSERRLVESGSRCPHRRAALAQVGPLRGAPQVLARGSGEPGRPAWWSGARGPLMPVHGSCNVPQPSTQRVGVRPARRACCAPAHRCNCDTTRQFLLKSLAQPAAHLFAGKRVAGSARARQVAVSVGCPPPLNKSMTVSRYCRALTARRV
jgi:hypothetical protein